MTTDITELAQRMKAAAVRAKTATEEYASGHMSVSVCFAECEEFNRLTDGPDNIITLVDALEKAQGMEAYWKTQCRGITDHCEELQARIAELESCTVKPPVHPTVASENLDDETLQELIEFRRTTFEYHSKEGNKVQTIIHGVTLSALRELQERRKADSEPVAEVLSNRPGNDTSTIDRALPVGTKLYRHAQPAVDSEFIPKNLDKALGVLGMAIPESREEFNFQTERWIQRLIDRVIRYADEFQEQPAPVVPDEVTAEDCPALVKYDVTEVDKAWARGFNACRAAMLSGGKP